MTRQLLPRPRAQVTTSAGPRTPPGAPTSREPLPARSRRLRRPAVLALVAGAAVVLAGLGWALVRAPQDVADERTSGLLRPRTPGAASPTASVTPTTGTGGGDAGARALRDPFGGSPAAPPGVTTGPTAPAGAPAPTSTVTTTVTAPGGPGVTTTATVTSTVTSTATRTATPTATPTVTITAPGSAVYVGFYAWNGSKASFRVNARTYSKPVGSTFGPQLRFTRVVAGSPRCARLTYNGGSPFTVCPGQVVKLP